jgi:DNA processing protein
VIAGLSAVTVVVEARERSGALITADLALEEGREVFAVPGEITSALSAGTNELLRLGAAPLLGSADVLDLFGLAARPPEVVDLTSTADAVLTRLRDGPMSADELMRSTGLDAATLASVLTELELAGRAVAARGVYRAN